MNSSLANAQYFRKFSNLDAPKAVSNCLAFFSDAWIRAGPVRAKSLVEFYFTFQPLLDENN